MQSPTGTIRFNVVLVSVYYRIKWLCFYVFLLCFFCFFISPQQWARHHLDVALYPHLSRANPFNQQQSDSATNDWTHIISSQRISVIISHMETMSLYADKHSRSIWDMRWRMFSGVKSGILDLQFLVAIGSAVGLKTANRKVLRLDD